ncbi:MAG: glycosyltransferase family 4 protein [Pseudomonadota bacterium]
MTLGYILNSYPMTSTTFIRREIEALERRGLTVKRYAIRHWDGELVDQRDIDEEQRVSYLLEGNAAGVARAFISEAISNFGPFLTAVRTLPKLASSAGGIKVLAYLAEAALLRQKCRADGVTHLHAHFGTNAAAVAMLCRLLGGPTYSFTAHGPDEFAIAEQQRYDLKIEHASFAIAITHFARMQLIRWGGPQYRDKIHVARCGLDLSEFEPSPVPEDANELICVGRLCPQKGQSLIPEAVAPVVRDHPDTKIVLIGDGESRPEIEAEIARLGLENNIELTGWMANKDVIERLKKARGLLLPSFAEGLPIVIMEAMALGRPVISTYIAGIPELLDAETGWIVPASSTEDLRDAMRGMMAATPEELTQLGAEGRRRIVAHHDIDGLAEAIARLVGIPGTGVNSEDATNGERTAAA